MDESVVLGFTGTRRGMTEAQKEAVRAWLRRYRPPVVHHGDCVGADEQFHDLVRETLPDTVIVIHPPTDSRHRAFCRGDRCRPPRPYLERNEAIVVESDVLLATPQTSGEQLRSGTWATVRLAQARGRPHAIFTPELKPGRAR